MQIQVYHTWCYNNLAEISLWAISVFSARKGYEPEASLKIRFMHTHTHTQESQILHDSEPLLLKESHQQRLSTNEESFLVCHSPHPGSFVH